MNIIDLDYIHKEETERIAAGTWGGNKIAAHHELFDIRHLPCFIAVSDTQKILGYCYYRFF